MTETTRRCALPGCAVAIEDVPGRPPRRYCTAAHRSAARQARRAAMQSGGDARLAATLPWLAEPAEQPPTPDAAPAAEAVTVAPQVPVNRAARRRAAALARRSDTPPGRRTRGLHTSVPHRRRALAVLGAAGILAGGYAVTASQPPAPTATEAAASEEDWARGARVTLASVNRQLDTIAQVEAEWLRLPEEQRAASPTGPVEALEQRRELLENRRATLLSQLDSFEELDTARAELAEAERALSGLESTLAAAPPPAQRSPEQAAALSALDEQRDLRIRQRDARRDELAALEGGVENAVARPLPDDVAETEQVGEQVRQVIRGEDVPAPAPAPASPLPTRPDVVGGRDEPDGAPRQDVDTSGPPDPRGPGDEGVDVPPSPPAPAPLAPSSPAPSPPAPEGPVDQLAQGVDGAVAGTADAVGGVLDGGARDRDRERSADRPGDPAPAPAESAPAAPAPAAEAPSGPVETVVDTVEDVADGPAPRDGDAGRSEQGPVGEVVDTVGGAVGDVVDGPDQPADEARDRERDRGGREDADAKRTAEQDAGPSATAGEPAAPVADAAAPVVDDRYPDPPAALRVAPVGPLRDADGARSAPPEDDGTPAPPSSVSPSPVSPAPGLPAAGVPSDDAELALEVVRSTPAAAWTAPLVEAALEQAARQDATGPAPVAPTSTGEAAASPWGYDDESIDALNEMAASTSPASSGSGGGDAAQPAEVYGVPAGSGDDRAELAAAYEEALLEAYGIPPAGSTGYADGGSTDGSDGGSGGSGTEGTDPARDVSGSGGSYTVDGYSDDPGTSGGPDAAVDEDDSEDRGGDVLGTSGSDADAVSADDADTSVGETDSDDTYADTDSDGTYADADSDGTYADSDADADTDTDFDSDSDTDFDFDTDADADSDNDDSDADADADADTDADADADDSDDDAEPSDDGDDPDPEEDFGDPED
ncbi:hypothetical protein GCM10017691_07190 [Pseudonocardia petroleophila]|uniref:Uncharacterized protein n=1 Tax=Pseudonocardia petroleophila TaxID=37331 RepID=A0A7G7MJV1_9PSEU|nr:hypothetical protein [Pseudonocardia petroleophila]QNG53062.1 hypothetical protein H6H00_03250 [Pseudonocardia petroleophila]